MCTISFNDLNQICFLFILRNYACQIRTPDFGDEVVIRFIGRGQSK